LTEVGWATLWLVVDVDVTFCGEGSELTTTLTRSGDNSGAGGDCFLRVDLMN
jgi:hypothetical protein